MRVPVVLCMSFVFVTMLACLRPAAAGAPGSSGSGTSAPPVPLGAEQLRAIADKGVPHAAAVPAGESVTQLENGKRVPMLTVQPLPGRADVAPHKALKLPMISPAIGQIPRPDWGLSTAFRKQADIAVIGDRRVTVAPPAANPTPATGHQP